MPFMIEKQEKVIGGCEEEVAAGGLFLKRKQKLSLQLKTRLGMHGFWEQHSVPTRLGLAAVRVSERICRPANGQVSDGIAYCCCAER